MEDKNLTQESGYSSATAAIQLNMADKQQTQESQIRVASHLFSQTWRINTLLKNQVSSATAAIQPNMEDKNLTQESGEQHSYSDKHRG